MRWIKMAEKLPEYGKKVFVRMQDAMWVGLLFKDSDDGFKGNILTLRGALEDVTGERIDHYEWLDESIPASIEDEAERLYPYDATLELNSNAQRVDQELTDIQRSAHITCAGMYLSRLAEMGELLMTKDGEIEGLKAELQAIKEEHDFKNKPLM